MAFAMSLRRLAATWKLPFILVGSARLRETSALFASADNTDFSPNLIEHQVRNPVPSVSRRRDDGGRVTHSKQKELKRRGFNAIIRWCAYHQELSNSRKCTSGECRDEEDEASMNLAVLQWVNESKENFSCGQNLVVLTFLCDVLQRQCTWHAASSGRDKRNGDEGLSSSSAASRAQRDELLSRLTHSIALLLTRAVTSEQLELQPFFILLAAVYGLARVADHKVLQQLPPEVVESLSPPSALWLALLHQLRAFYAVAGEAEESLDTNVNTEALLTVLLLFDDAQCNLYFAPNDYKMIDGLTRRLVRLLQPALAASRSARAQEAAAAEKRVFSADEALPSPTLAGEREDGAGLLDAVEDDAEADARMLRSATARNQVSHNASGQEESVEFDGESLASSLANSPRDERAAAASHYRISLRDCCRILARARTSSVQCRLDLLEYFLCVVHDPAHLTEEEVQLLPSLFDAPRQTREVQGTDLAAYVVRKRGITDVQLLAPLLPFMRKLDNLEALVESQLGAEPGRSQPLEPDVAFSILLTIGTKLSWGVRKVLLRACLAECPQVLHAVDAALAGVDRSGGGVSSSISITKESIESRVVQLTPNLCLLLRHLFLFELRAISPQALSDHDSTNSSSSGDKTLTTQREVMAVAGAVVRSIDWSHCAAEQIAHERRAGRHVRFLPTSIIAIGVLAAYLDSLDTFHFLTAAEAAMDDRVLLNTLVLPLLRSTNQGTRRQTNALLEAVLPHLSSVEYRRQLVRRAMQANLATKANPTTFFYVVHHFLVPATELAVESGPTLAYLTAQHTLLPRKLPGWTSDQVNLSKAYTTFVVRVVRYLLAVGVLSSNSKGESAHNNTTTSKSDSSLADPAKWHALLTSWFGHYFNTVSSVARRGDLLREQPAAMMGLHEAEADEEGDAAKDEADADGVALSELKEATEGDLEQQDPDKKHTRSRDNTEDDADTNDVDVGDDVNPQESSSANKNNSNNSHEDAEDEGEEDGAAENISSVGRQRLSEAFTAPVTEADLEVVLTLMLQTGVKASTRALTLIAQRLRDKAIIANARPRLPADPLESAESEEPEERFTKAPQALELQWAGEERSGGGMGGLAADEDTSSLEGLPLPAHFVFAVRADSALTIPLNTAYLTTLLTQCDLAIFHHVLSAFFAALRRRRSVVVLQHDMQIVAIAMDLLQKRLAAFQVGNTSGGERREEDLQKVPAPEVLSEVAFKSLVRVLLHLTQLPTHTPHLRAFVVALHTPSPTLARDDPPASPSLATVPEEKEGGAENGADGAHAFKPDATTEEEKSSWQTSLRVAHRAAASSILQVSAFIAPSQLKEFTLGHLNRLALFFPETAGFIFLQVRPQLSNFAQRELLQAATQYPAGAAEILVELSKVDMHVSIDLGEFVPMAKKLPMQLNEAIIHAHVPYMTIAWVTRVLSALAGRHEAVPLGLLHALLSRVEALADTASESDKSLLLLILQGYLLFTPATSFSGGVDATYTTAAAADSNDIPGAYGNYWGHVDGDRRENQTWMDGFLLQHGAVTALSLDEQRQRIDLVRHCCDLLLSLEKIATLEELRYFLVSYPPSLHQLRERGVVATVEQKLLPAMLTASPVRWAEVDTLVSLLAEHRVLLPHTVHQISAVLFTPAQLEALQQASLASLQSDSAAVLTGCLRIAVACAAAVRAVDGTSPVQTAECFSLLPTVDAVLAAFDVAQDWLAALTTFVAAQSKPKGYGAAPAASQSGFAADAQQTVSRHLCALLLREADELNPGEFARLVQCVSRLRAWDLVTGNRAAEADGPSAAVSEGNDNSADFSRTFRAMLARADAHSRCVLLKAVATDAGVFRRFEGIILRDLLRDIALLSPEDLESVLGSALQVSDVAIVEPLLDAVGTRLLPMMDQCRRSTLVRLLQCHAVFHVEDTAVVLAALAALDRQSSMEVKLDATQVIIVLQAIAQLPMSDTPERLVLLCFQRLEKVMQTLSPTQLYEVGRLILDLEMGYISCIHLLVTHILESRDGPRGHRRFHAVAEELCDVYDIEVAAPLRAARLRKRQHKKRIQAFYAAQRRALQEA